MRYTRDCGFTLIELIVGMVITSVLFLSIAGVFYADFLHWFRSANFVELQRDGTMAMDMIGRLVRPAKKSIVITSGSTLTVGTKRIYQTGQNIFYDPDTGISGNEVAIVRNRTSSLLFSENESNHSVHVNMVLQDTTNPNGESVIIDSIIKYRS